MGGAEGIEMAEMFARWRSAVSSGAKEGVLWIRGEVRKNE